MNSPTFGSTWLEKVPLYCGGVSVITTEAGPPFTITADTGSVEVQLAPLDDAPDSVTTCSLPAGFSNAYPWKE